MRVYIESNSVDDTMFDLWIMDALRKFKGSTKILERGVYNIKNHRAELPNNIKDVEEAWIVYTNRADEIKHPTSTFYMSDCRITEITDRCNECFEEGDCGCQQRVRAACNSCHQPPTRCSCDQIPEQFQVLNKLTGTTVLTYSKQVRIDECGSKNHEMQDPCYTLDGCIITTTIGEGTLHVEYSTHGYSSEGTPLMEENYYIEMYLREHLKYKVFEDLVNSSEGEPLNALLKKYQIQEQKMWDAFVVAETELKKFDKRGLKKLIDKRKKRFNNYRRINLN